MRRNDRTGDAERHPPDSCRFPRAIHRVHTMAPPWQSLFTTPAPSLAEPGNPSSPLSGADPTTFGDRQRCRARGRRIHRAPRRLAQTI